MNEDVESKRTAGLDWRVFWVGGEMKKILFGVVAAALSLAAAQAYAQSAFERDRNVSVRERPHEDYVSDGLRWGAFAAYPKLTVDAEYNDSIFAVDTGAEGDLIWRVRPELVLESGWSRHKLGAYARASLSRYSEFESENSDDWFVGASGRLDVVGNSYLYGGVDYARATEPRTSAGSPIAAAEPVPYTMASAQLGGVHEINRLRLSALGSFSDYDYDDVPDILGGTISQNFRDHQVAALGGKVEYAMSPAVAVFLYGAGNRRTYDLHPPAVALDRESKGYEVTAGADFDITELARGQVGVGYIRQDYDSPGAKDLSGLAMRGQVEWFPTQLTTVTLKAERAVGDSGVVDSAGFVQSGGSVQVDWEVRRNVILTANAGLDHDDYRDIDRNDDRFTAGLSAAYLINRNLGVNVGYQYYDQSSSGANRGAEFSTNRVMVSLVAQF